MTRSVLKTGEDTNHGESHAKNSKSLNGPILYRRDDWTEFCSLERLPQKAGVPLHLLPRLIPKELTDNALDELDKLDEAGDCRIAIVGNGFVIEDDGAGIPGTDDEIADLFSVSRQLTSSKVLRLPTRGALGNGLRVVTGAVLATGGSLVVSTGGRTLRLIPERRDGTTRAEFVADFAGQGTKIEIQFGPALAVNGDALQWALDAIAMARFGGDRRYTGASSPHWQSDDSFYDVLQAAKGVYVRDVIAALDGCANPRAGMIAKDFKGRTADSLTEEEAERLLRSAKQAANPVTATRLKRIGDIHPLKYGYKLCDAIRTSAGTTVPAVIECWACIEDDDGFIESPFASRSPINVFCNRTPIPAEITAWSADGCFQIHGCGLAHSIEIGRKAAPTIWLNVECPHIPIVSDGKEPDLEPFLEPIAYALRKAVSRARRATVRPGGTKVSFKSAVIELLPEGIENAGGGGTFGQRGLFYQIRDLIDKRYPDLGELKWGTFTGIITDYENEIGHDIPGMDRDERGVLYIPHSGVEIPLGTDKVRQYKHQKYYCNKVLYIEKETHFRRLIEEKWPERHDCALMTAKGFANRAARDVIDMLADTGERIKFFCLHDADAYGTMIYQALQEATKARPARKVRIINLGLHPKQAMDMGLRPERVEQKRNKKGKIKRRPVADYVKSEKTRAWYQKYRIEVNALPMVRFLKWLDEIFEPYDKKVIPPAPVMTTELNEKIEESLRDKHKARALAEYKVDERVAKDKQALAGRIKTAKATLTRKVARALDKAPEERWSAEVDRIAEKIASTEP
jgi:hypothetical protein